MPNNFKLDRATKKKVISNLIYKVIFIYFWLCLMPSYVASHFSIKVIYLNLAILIIYISATYWTMNRAALGFLQLITLCIVSILIVITSFSYLLYTSFPHDIAIWTIVCAIIGLLFFAIKRFFDIDYNYIRKTLKTKQRYNIVEQAYYIDDANSAAKDLNRLYRARTPKQENFVRWLAGPMSWIILIAMYTVPTMPYILRGIDGDRPRTYFIFLCMSFITGMFIYGTQKGYAIYKVLREVEKENGIKLRPVYRP